MGEIRKKKTKYLFYLLSFLIAWIMLFWKCRYGFPLDESFYILFCYRFINGDIPILHEWNPTQISILWLHPFVWLFYKLNNSNEQIILSFRYLYTIIWGLSALFLFLRMRKFSFIGAAVSSLIFLLFVPYGQMALYYNTFGLITFTSSLIIVITAKKNIRLQYAISGFLFAVAVTCCPFLIFLYCIFLFVAIILALKKNKELLYLFYFFTVGIIPAIILFYIYYIAPSSLSDFFGGLHYLLSDRQHQFTYSEKIIDFFKIILFSSPFVIIVFSVVMITVIFVILKKTNESKIVGFILVCIASLILDITYLYRMDPSSNSFVFASFFLGLYCGLTNKSEKTKKVFNFIWIPGFIYMFCINISSEVGFEAVMIPAVICAIASCFLSCFFISEVFISEHSILSKKICVSAFSVLVVFSLGIMFYGRSIYAFGNGTINNLTARIEQGPNKGIYCSPGFKKYYYGIVSDLEPLKNSNYDKVLLLTNYWFYLDIEKKPILCSCFYPFVDDILLDQLEEYYNIYPQFIPEVIYIGNNQTQLLSRVRAYGYSGLKTKNGGYILYRE